MFASRKPSFEGLTPEFEFQLLKYFEAHEELSAVVKKRGTEHELAVWPSRMRDTSCYERNMELMNVSDIEPTNECG
ncbi:hypothetical protein C2W62_46620 [Candidatus Entotheonella serta]|nr:hypothetical protein C2W62_46620 [Candidatus Entotheonella serta]